MKEWEVYEASEDTYLLIDALMRDVENIKDKRVMEIGCGQGKITEFLCALSNLVVAGDVNKKAILSTISLLQKSKSNGNNVFAVVGDGAKYIKKGSIDVYVFNPPYLPSPLSEFIDLDGGERGIDVTLSFIQHIINNKVEGEEIYIYFITSSLADIDFLRKEVFRLCEGYNINAVWEVILSANLNGEILEANRIVMY